MEQNQPSRCLPANKQEPSSEDWTHFRLMKNPQMNRIEFLLVNITEQVIVVIKEMSQHRKGVK